MKHKSSTAIVLTGLLMVVSVFCSVTYAVQRERLIPAALVDEGTVHGKAAEKHDRNAQLRGAVYKGEVAEIERLLNSGADIDAGDEYGFTPLMRAIESGRREIVRLLLDHGADGNTRTKCGWTALMMAGGGGDTYMTRLLLDKGADVNARDNGGVTALMDSVRHPEIAELLLDNGAVINAKDKGGMTALAWAVNDGSLETTKLLRGRGAEMTLPIAVLLQDVPEIRRLIQSGADVNARDGAGSSALVAAVRTGDLDLVKLLLDSGAAVDATPQGAQALQMAKEHDYKDIADHLRNRGARPLESLQAAKLAGKCALRGDEIFLRLKDSTIVALKDTPPTPEDLAGGYTDPSGATNVSYAFEGFIDPWYVIHEGYFEGDGIQFINRDTGEVKEVHGAGPFSPDNTRFLSIGYPGGSPCNAEIWKLSRGGIAREWLAEDFCLYSYQWADSSTVEMLSHCGGRGENNLIIARVKLEGNSWKCSSAEGMSASEGEAVCSGNGAEPRSRGHDETPELIEATWSGDVRKVKKALDKGADVNEKDMAGWTALMHAATRGRSDMVIVLLENGADASVKDRQGRSALMLAASQGKPEVVKLLQDRDAEETMSIAACLGDVQTFQRLIREGADVKPGFCEPSEKRGLISADFAVHFDLILVG